MKKICQFIISFILMSSLMLSGILCSAAILEDNLDADQQTTILQNASATGLKNFSSTSTYWVMQNYTDSLSNANYVLRGNKQSGGAISSTSFTLNLPFYLSGFDSLSIQFVVFGTYSGGYPFNNFSFYQVNGSVATALSFQEIGSATLTNVKVPGSTTSATYNGRIYQVTVNSSIDFLRVQFGTWYSSSDINYMMFGFSGIYVQGTSEALQNIEYQVSQIGTKVDDLKTAIQAAASNIGGIATNQGNILTSVNQIKGLAQTLVDNQEIIMYSSDDDQLILTELDTRTQDVKDALTEYKTIINQYHNPPDVNNVTNVIQQGIPEQYNPQEFATVLTAALNNSIVTTILITLGAVCLLSYVLFGKKG